MDYSIELKKEEVKKIILLPTNFEVFKATNGEDRELPYLKFYRWLAKQLNVDTKDINVSEVCLSSAMYGTLEAYTKIWVKKSVKYKIPQKRLDFETGMLSLNYGPVNVKGDFVNNKNVYIREV